MRLIVNADDFGLDESTSLAIVEAFKRRICSNTTIMVNMPFATQSVDLARANGFDDKIGLHFNIIEGFPLTQKIRRSSLFCNEDGSFNGKLNQRGASLFKTFLSRSERSALLEETEAQIDRYFSLGLSEMHFDSHCHSHFVPAVASSVWSLFQRRGFISTRRYFNISSSCREQRSALKRAYQSFVFRYKNVCCSKLPTLFKTTDFFGLPKTFGERVNVLPLDAVCELMIHPRYDGSRSRLFDHFGKICENRPMEETEEFYLEYRSSLLSYRDI